MRKTVVLCDLDDGEDPRPGVAVVEMAIDGVFRPLDVCAEHLELLRSLPQHERPARRPRPAPSARERKAPPTPTPAVKRPAKPPTATTSRATASGTSQPAVPSRRQPTSRRSRRARIAAAREWARAQGREVADLGRLPAGLLEEYEAAHR